MDLPGGEEYLVPDDPANAYEVIDVINDLYEERQVLERLPLADEADQRGQHGVHGLREALEAERGHGVVIWHLDVLDDNELVQLAGEPLLVWMGATQLTQLCLLYTSPSPRDS